ncbi:toll/interleukin-1 receptor domain-containing protein [Pseudomonas sp. B19125]|uniref:toll/interleukin-1 receptor domain-containing protein n=1 Tax=Pseudomonas sp. B19125 TaxID=3235109 RepID=UPI003783B4DE
MKLFLSHNSKDKPIVRRVASYLEQKGYEVWLDEWEMTPGDSLITKISEGVEGADKLLVFLSPTSVESEWVKKEVNGGLIMEVAEEKGLGNKFVIPVLIEACKVPFMLREKLYSNFTNKSLEDACEELVSGIEGKTRKNELEPYSNLVVKMLDLGQDDGKYFSFLIEVTSNLSPISGLTIEIATSGYLQASEHIGASGDYAFIDGMRCSLQNCKVHSDGAFFSRRFTGPEIKKGISYFLKFVSAQPLVINSFGCVDGYGVEI